ncbi:uncharacterized protein [Amphiura filiformis]|uniref:uncharacterized protein n=1 Tax=Amphiura filiformis TaxID=82378 RepID=UPI003B226225
MPLPAIKPHVPKYTHEHLINNSPLKKRDYIQPTTLPSIIHPTQLKEREDKFILDCILVEKLRYKWSADIIPKYDALDDEHAAHYFKSPLVKQTLRKTLGQEIIGTRDGRFNLNTLSTRHRVPRSPSPEKLKERREQYVNNSVAATNAVTKYNPLNPPYNALTDKHAREYFQRKGVARSLSVTLSQLRLRPKSIY